MTRATTRSTPPVEHIWALLADVERWGELLPTVTSVRRLGGPDPTGVGSRFEVRQPGLPAAVYDVTVWRPLEGFTWVARSPGLVSTATHTVTAAEGGSVLDLRFEWSGLLAPLVRVLASRTAQRYLDTEAATFAR